MKDCEGREHDGNAPLTWWYFDREMAHRDRLEDARRKALQDAIDLRAKQLLTSHRIIVAGFSQGAATATLATYTYPAR